MKPHVDWKQLSQDQKEELRIKNNPQQRPVGPFTGRCSQCESDDLWDDATWYGCNCCGAMFPNG